MTKLKPTVKLCPLVCDWVLSLCGLKVAVGAQLQMMEETRQINLLNCFLIYFFSPVK